jgi:hypothetical protein
MCFYSKELLAPRANTKLEDHHLSAVSNCFFSKYSYGCQRLLSFKIFVATLHIGGRSSIRNLRTRHAVVTGNHL